MMSSEDFTLEQVRGMILKLYREDYGIVIVELEGCHWLTVYDSSLEEKRKFEVPCEFVEYDYEDQDVTKALVPWFYWKLSEKDVKLGMELMENEWRGL